MSYVAHTETRHGFTLTIEQDEDACDPLKDFDNASTFVCDHGRYNLGHEDGHRKAREAIYASRDYKERWEERYDFANGPDLFRMIQECSDIVWLPLYLYDHSGITISTGKFSCPWDSGQVGFAFITRADVLKEYGGNRLTKAIIEKAENLIRGEVETYDTYLRGEVYGYVIEDEDGDHLDACWGFYGIDYATQEGQAALQTYADEKLEEEATIKKDGQFLDAIGVPAI